jgi:hypothetical protein
MTLKKLGLGALAAAATLAFVLGTAGVSEAAKKKAKAEPAKQPVCMFVDKPVCATKGGKRVTYANACFAANDGATGIKAGACKAAKGGGKKAAKKKK